MTHAKPRRLLLCRAQGGLNDMLCQIENACRYAERFDRIVHVDTNFPGARNFRDSLAKYFVSRDPRLVLDADEIGADLDAMPAIPSFLSGRVSNYATHFDHRLSRLVESESGQPVSFDFDRDHDAPLLVHHSAGGGMTSLAALARLRLHDVIVDALVARLRSIGGPYTAVHIRNTDYETRYASWLLAAKDRIAGPIFVATDDAACLADCREVLGRDRVYAFSRLPEVSGMALHNATGSTSAFERNSDAILDLLMLALARDYFFLELEENPFGARYSGFSLLAQNLREFTPILDGLLARRDSILDAVRRAPGR